MRRRTPGTQLRSFTVLSRLFIQELRVANAPTSRRQHPGLGPRYDFSRDFTSSARRRGFSSIRLVPKYPNRIHSFRPTTDGGGGGEEEGILLLPPFVPETVPRPRGGYKSDDPRTGRGCRRRMRRDLNAALVELTAAGKREVRDLIARSRRPCALYRFR